MRVTLGELFRRVMDTAAVHQRKPPSDEAVPSWVEPEVVLPVMTFYYGDGR